MTRQRAPARALPLEPLHGLLPYCQHLRVAVADGILTLTLHNPEKRNASTPAMHAALARIWDDDFTISGADWEITEFQFFTYQTGSTTTSTINNLRVQIYNGPPNAGGTVIWGRFDDKSFDLNKLDKHLQSS